ncbi:MAG: hypothetical protein RL033_4499 [Pseudomonadota bacterium]|jgi:hypothetical protein
MSRRGFELLAGSVVLLLLALHAPVVVTCGLACAAWMMRRSAGELSVEAGARAAMLGGFVGPLLLGLLLLTGVPSLVGASLAFTRDFLLNDAGRTSLGLFLTGLAALLQSFFLGLSIRLIGPSLPR